MRSAGGVLPAQGVSTLALKKPVPEVGLNLLDFKSKTGKHTWARGRSSAPDHTPPTMRIGEVWSGAEDRKEISGWYERLRVWMNVNNKKWELVRGGKKV